MKNIPPRKTILLVDDVPVNLRILGQALKPYFKIIVAANGKKALDLLESENPPDMIITDINMPEMDGYQLTEAIRRWEEEKGGRLPIIGLTAGSGRAAKKKCLEVGMDEYLMKSTDSTESIKIINRLLGIKQEPLHRDSPTPSSNGEAVFNLDSLRKKLGNDEQKVKEMLKWVVEDMEAQINLVKEGIKDGLAAQVRDAVHRAKGAATHLEAVKLLEIFKNMEILAEEERLDAVRGYLEKARVGFEELREWVNRELD